MRALKNMSWMLILFLFSGSIYAASDYGFNVRGQGNPDPCRSAVLAKKDPYTRGGNLTITWKMWRDNPSDNPNWGTNYMSGDPDYGTRYGTFYGPSFFGPMWTSMPDENFGNSSWATIESGLVGWPYGNVMPWANGVASDEGTPKTYSDWFWVCTENTGNAKFGLNAGSAFGTAFVNAKDKASCVSTRFTLGDHGGHKMEYSNNAQATWTQAYEILDAADGGSGARGGDTAASIYFGFINTGIGGLIFDDIVILQNGATVFTENFDNGTLNTTTWSAYGQTGSTGNLGSWRFRRARQPRRRRRRPRRRPQRRRRP